MAARLSYGFFVLQTLPFDAHLFRPILLSNSPTLFFLVLLTLFWTPYDSQIPLFWKQSNRNSICILLSMSLCLPSMTPVQAIPRSSVARGRPLTLSFLLLVVFIVLVSVKLISEQTAENHPHAIGKRQFQAGALFGETLQQVRKPVQAQSQSGLARKHSHIAI